LLYSHPTADAAVAAVHRNPANFPYDRHYETNGWFYVDNAVVNLMKNRYVITMPLMGMPVSTTATVPALEGSPLLL
jgi:hypothetical protein